MMLTPTPLRKSSEHHDQTPREANRIPGNTTLRRGGPAARRSEKTPAGHQARRVAAKGPSGRDGFAHERVAQIARAAAAEGAWTLDALASCVMLRRPGRQRGAHHYCERLRPLLSSRIPSALRPAAANRLT